MIKFTQGMVENIITKEKRAIIVRAKSANKLKDILIGGVLIVGGVVYLTSTAFRNGSKAYEKAEFEALCSAGILTKPFD